MVKHKVIHQMIFVFSVTLITLEITVKYRKVLSITIEQDVFQDIACFSSSFKVSVHPRSDFYRGHPMSHRLCDMGYVSLNIRSTPYASSLKCKNIVRKLSVVCSRKCMFLKLICILVLRSPKWKFRTIKCTILFCHRYKNKYPTKISKYEYK